MMHIPMVVLVLLTVLAWILPLLCFEAVWQALRNKSSLSIHKGAACRIWWLFLGVCALAGGLGQFLLSLPLLATFGLSHCNLAETHDDIITLSQVAKNIPAGLRDFADKIRPYLK